MKLKQIWICAAFLYVYDFMIKCKLLAQKYCKILIRIKSINIFTAMKFSSSLVSHLYGIFSGHGYKNDSRYPLSYSVADVVLDNVDCVQHGSLFCNPNSYQSSAPTKQNILCHNR